MELVLQRKDAPDVTDQIGPVTFTPPIDDEYWAYRVIVSPKQAVVGFPKFFTIGIGFAFEEDWNTNLPYTSSAEDIYEHIAHNKADDAVSRETCLQAIRLIQDAVAADKEAEAAANREK